MNNTARNTKAHYKGSLLKRLIRESLILSCLSSLSERIIKLFGSGIFYIIFCGCDETDAYLKKGVIGRLTAKTELNTRIIRPFKFFFASGIEHSRIVSFYRRIIGRLLAVSIRFYGILICTLGIYGVGIYLAKMLSYITETPDTNELFWSVFLFIAGIPMLMSGRSVSAVLKTSRFFGWFFVGILGINEMALREYKKPETHGTAAFVSGTVLGLITIFVSTPVIAFVFLSVVLCASILYTPELGLLSAVMLFPIISVRLLAALLVVTTICYFLKVLRAKRNLRFKTADIFVLFFGFYIIALGLLSGSGGQVRAVYLLCFLAVYFLIANLIASERLIKQTLYAFCIGSGLSCSLFILQHIAGGIENIYIDPLLNLISTSLVGKSSYGYFLVLLLPICLALFKTNNFKSEKAALLVLSFLTSACIIIMADRLILVSAYMAVFLYILFAYKKPISTVLLFSVISPVIYFWIPFIPFLNDIFSQTYTDLMSGGTDKLVGTVLPTGVGIGDRIMLLALNKTGASNYIGNLGLLKRLIIEGGLFYLISFLLAVFFILQRCFNYLVRCKNTRIGFILSAFSAVLFIFLSLGMFYDMWEDIRIYMLFWVVCGVISAVKNVYGRTAYLKDGEERE